MGPKSYLRPVCRSPAGPRPPRLGAGGEGSRFGGTGKISATRTSRVNASRGAFFQRAFEIGLGSFRVIASVLIPSLRAFVYSLADLPGGKHASLAKDRDRVDPREIFFFFYFSLIITSCHYVTCVDNDSEVFVLKSLNWRLCPKVERRKSTLV